MDQYIFDKNNGLWYKLQGDYYIPCLAVPAEEEMPIGIWGAAAPEVYQAGTQSPVYGATERRQTEQLSCGYQCPG